MSLWWNLHALYKFTCMWSCFRQFSVVVPLVFRALLFTFVCWFYTGNLSLILCQFIPHLLLREMRTCVVDDQTVRKTMMTVHNKTLHSSVCTLLWTCPKVKMGWKSLECSFTPKLKLPVTLIAPLSVLNTYTHMSVHMLHNEIMCVNRVLLQCSILVMLYTTSATSCLFSFLVLI